MTDVFIVGAARTPIGSFQGALSTVPAPKLGSASLKAALTRAGVEAASLDEVYMGQVLTAGVGQAPARQAALAAGVPEAVPTATIGKVCGSGLMAGILAARAIRSGDAQRVAAGGMEAMSAAPYLAPGARAGLRMGHAQLLDSMVHDGLWDPYDDFHMGCAGELCAEKYGFSREAQDAFAKRSYERALAAQQSGAFEAELTPVDVVGRKATTTVSVDEEPGRGRLDAFAKLRPAFKKDGTITAANASSINDGAAALVFASGDVVQRDGLKPLARVVGAATHAQSPKLFTTAPVGACRKLLEAHSLAAQDIDLWEVNEAFSVVPMAFAEEFGIDAERMNVHGGAVALGHPIGASGARVLVTLLYAMAAREARRGIATLCIGGGEGVAMLVERP